MALALWARFQRKCLVWRLNSRFITLSLSSSCYSACVRVLVFFAFFYCLCLAEQCDAFLVSHSTRLELRGCHAGTGVSVGCCLNSCFHVESLLPIIFGIWITNHTNLKIVVFLPLGTILAGFCNSDWAFGPPFFASQRYCVTSL